MEMVSLFEAQPDRQFKIGTTLSSPLRTKFIAFLSTNTKVSAWSYDDMPDISPDVINRWLSISLNFKPIWQKWWTYDAERYEAMRLEVENRMVRGECAKIIPI